MRLPLETILEKLQRVSIFFQSNSPNQASMLFNVVFKLFPINTMSRIDQSCFMVDFAFLDIQFREHTDIIAIRLCVHFGKRHKTSSFLKLEFQHSQFQCLRSSIAILDLYCLCNILIKQKYLLSKYRPNCQYPGKAINSGQPLSLISHITNQRFT